jgi:cell fate regulator YaaT (PSP1 superfamily)
MAPFRGKLRNEKLASCLFPIHLLSFILQIVNLTDMGCSSCGTANGKPSGCKSNGGCSTGGCNRLNVHDWLANLPFSDPESGCRVVEVSFNQGSRKEFFRNSTTHIFDKGDWVSVEGVSGFDVGTVTLTGEIVRLQMKKKNIEELNPEMKKILRRASDKDMDLMQQNKAREKEAMVRSRAIARQLKLDMKVSEVEIQADGRKGTFYYIADDRVDFRELIKIFAGEFRLKVEMRQIGARQEAAKVGGIGSCGRELCCSTWLSDFKSVNTTAARYQNLSINQSKLSGQCGRLKCCLNYELDTYLDALQHFPDNAETLQLAKGTALLIKKDIFKNLMWYVLPDSSKQYPVDIEQVKKIKKLNAQNIIPDALQPVEVNTGKPKVEESGFVDLVGQISLKTLEKADRKKRQQRQQSARPPGTTPPPIQKQGPPGAPPIQKPGPPGSNQRQGPPPPNQRRNKRR